MRLLVTVLLGSHVLFGHVCELSADETIPAEKRELVVTVLDKLTYLDQITPREAAAKRKELSDADYQRWLRDYRAGWLVSSVSGRVLKEYAIREKLKPSDEEIDALIAEAERKQAENIEGDKEARQKLALQAFWVRGSSYEWRTAKALHEKYGGRVAISSFGACTSFEGRNAVLKDYAGAGDIKFHDADLERAFWEKTKDERIQDVTLPAERVKEHFAAAPWERWIRESAHVETDRKDKRKPTRLRVLNADGSRVQSFDVVIANVGFPKPPLERWVGEPDREGLVSLEELPAGTAWLLAAGMAEQRTLFQMKLPIDEPVLEQRLRAGRPWFGNDVEIGRQPIVRIDEKDGEVIVIEIRNGTKAPMKVSEDDLHLKAMVGDDLFRCLPPRLHTPDPEPVSQTRIEAGQTGQIRLEWREWATRGIWLSRRHEVITEPAWPEPAPGKVCVCVGLGQSSSLAVTVTDPVTMILVTPEVVRRPGSAAKPKRTSQFRTGENVKTIACSADGKLIAVANGNPTFILQENGRSHVVDDWKPSVEVLDAETGKPVVLLKLTTSVEDALLATTERVPDFEVEAVAFSPTGNMVAVGTSVGQVKLFNARTGELVRSLDDERAKLADKEITEKLKPLTRALGSVASLAFSPDGSLLATCGGSFNDVPLVAEGNSELGRSVTSPGRLKVWEVKTETLKHDLVGHAHANAVAFSPDGFLLASAGSWEDDRERGTGAILWNPESGEKIRIMTNNDNGGTWSVAFSPDSKHLAIGSLSFDKDKDPDVCTFAISLAHVASGILQWRRTYSDLAKPVGFFPDGECVLVLDGGHTMRLLDVETGRVSAALEAQSAAQGGRCNDFVIGKRGHMLAIGGVDSERKGSVEVWDFDAISGR